MMHPTYYVQHGCYDCKYSFEYVDWDEWGMFYCTFQCPPRPKCGSSVLDEKVHGDEVTAWYEWAREHRVEAYGICDMYEKKRDE